MKADMHKLEVIMSRHKVQQKNLAKKAGVSRRTVTTVCNGRSVRPSTLGLIAAALGVDVEDIMAEEA